MAELLAKSPHGKHRITLLQHTHDVMDAVEGLYCDQAQPSRLGRAWLRFFKLPTDLFPKFRQTLLAAAAFHDLGKANDDFQRCVQGSKQRQRIRHEHLSGLFVTLHDAACWIQQQPDVDFDVMLSAVLTHHLKIKFDAFAPHFSEQPILKVGFDQPEFRHLLEEIAIRLRWSKTLPGITVPARWGFPDGGRLGAGVFDLQKHREQVKDERLRRFQVALGKDDRRKRLLWAVRAALIAADAVGSGLPRIGKSMQDWIQQVFDERRISTSSFVREQIIERRVDQLKRLNQWGKWTDFQDHCARPERVPSRALLLAPCGSGKTLAAWRWIETQLHDAKRHVVFLYPTRATAKEGFRDYVSWAPEADASLMHGTSEFDLKDMFTNPDDDRRGNHYELEESERRLFALGFWTKRIFSATVDQFLAFLQYAYGPMCMLPVLADSVIVIDEVHSFDRNMFAALKSFLRNFDVPVLCMTATLPNSRREELAKECGLTVYDDKPGELRIMADAPRYHLRRTTADEVPERIRHALTEGKRVLWVVNQVKRAQQAALRMARDFLKDTTQSRLHVQAEVPLYCYHSRFRLSDRVERHNNVVQAFKQNCPAALAITTQVCEMSLDMDADLLVTEECPITSLIQRMGRCNRARIARPSSGEILVYKPDKSGPYKPDDLTGLEGFLDTLAQMERLNQSDLERALEASPSPATKGDPATSFLTSGPYAFADDAEDFREIEEFNRSAVLRRDLEEFLRSDASQKPGLILPVPRKFGQPDPRLPHHVTVAPDEHYHAALGFCDLPLEQMAEVGNE